MPRLNDATRNEPLSAAASAMIQSVAAQVLRDVFDAAVVSHAAHQWRDMDVEVEHLDACLRRADGEDVNGLLLICAALGIPPPREAMEYPQSPEDSSHLHGAMTPCSADMAERPAPSHDLHRHRMDRHLPSPIRDDNSREEPPVSDDILMTLLSLDTPGSAAPTISTGEQTLALIQAIDQEMQRLDAQDRQDAQDLDAAEAECRFVSHLHEETEPIRSALAAHERALRMACQAVGLDEPFTRELQQHQRGMRGADITQLMYLARLAAWPEGRTP